MSKLSKKERKHAQKIFNGFLIEELRNVNKKLSELEKYQKQLNASDNIARICERLNKIEARLTFEGRGQQEQNTTIYELKKTHDAAREQANRQAVAIETLQTQMKNLTPRITNCMDAVIEMQETIKEITTKDMQKSIDKLTSKRGKVNK